MISPEIQQYVQNAIKNAQNEKRYSTKNAEFVTHNGIDAPRVDYNNLLNLPSSSSSSISGSSTGAQNDVNTGYVLIEISSNDFANGITWTGSPSYQFTVTTAGVYLIVGVIGFSATGTGAPFETWIYKNGTALFSGYATAPSSTDGVYPVAAKIVQLAVGDYIQLYSYQSASSTQGLYTSQTYLNIASV